MKILKTNLLKAVGSHLEDNDWEHTGQFNDYEYTDEDGRTAQLRVRVFMQRCVMFALWMEVVPGSRSFALVGTRSARCTTDDNVLDLITSIEEVWNEFDFTKYAYC